jgi:hypothetical protein
MNDLKNHWLKRIELKRQILQAIKQKFVPPIYKQLPQAIKNKKP